MKPPMNAGKRRCIMKFNAVTHSLHEHGAFPVSHYLRSTAFIGGSLFVVDNPG
jgi:hypothetical protein